MREYRMRPAGNRLYGSFQYRLEVWRWFAWWRLAAYDDFQRCYEDLQRARHGAFEDQNTTQEKT